MAPTIEDISEFDDPDDLPLPYRPLPSTANGPILEEIRPQTGSGLPAWAQSARSQAQTSAAAGSSAVHSSQHTLHTEKTLDIAPFKKCVQFA